MRPHVVVLHRWRARYAEYERYIDHGEYAVSYVTTEVGAPSVSPGAAAVAVVDATDDLSAVTVEVKRLAERFGPPAAIVGLKEDDLLVAARLRQEWGCPGPTPQELVPFRDKLAMATRVAAAGLAVPAFSAVSSVPDVLAFGAARGWPVVVKPRIGSSAVGVVQVSSASDLAAPDALDFEGAEQTADAGDGFGSEGPMLAQSFDARPIHHVDGYFDGERFGPFRASRYVNTCLGFRTGDMLGSVEIDDPLLLGALGEFGSAALRALTARPTVFHLELFVDPATRECAFLEVGARVGGAEIAFLWREVHGYDLMEAGFRLAMGWTPRAWPAGLGARRPAAYTVADAAGAEGSVAGWLLAPAPAARPCRITEATPMVGRVPGPYAEALLRPGEVLPAADAYYEHVGGRFRFRGHTSAEVEAAVSATARDFRVGAE